MTNNKRLEVAIINDLNAGKSFLFISLIKKEPRKAFFLDILFAHIVTRTFTFLIETITQQKLLRWRQNIAPLIFYNWGDEAGGK